jgi:NADH-quinone oxidoreductase subunit J
MMLFGIVAAVMLASSIAALMLRNLIHCALALAVALSALAALYIQLGAQFVGFAQVLVYVGAVAILIVFAILLTRPHGAEGEERSPALWWTWSGWVSGITTAIAVFAVLVAGILHSGMLRRKPTVIPTATVREIGAELMTQYILPLEVLGLLLTAALIGAVIVALREPELDHPSK